MCLYAMDLGSFLKDATRTIEKLGSDVTKLGSDVTKEIGLKSKDEQAPGGATAEAWNGWVSKKAEDAGNGWDVDEEWQDVDAGATPAQSQENKVCDALSRTNSSRDAMHSICAFFCFLQNADYEQIVFAVVVGATK